MRKDFLQHMRLFGCPLLDCLKAGSVVIDDGDGQPW